MNKLKFFSESLKNLKRTGTITRSSKYLCEKMVEPVDFKNSKVIVELGAGDGVVTEYILREMRKDATLLTFEINEEFAKTISDKIKDKRMVLITDSADKLPEYLAKYGFEHADNIVSALPFVSLPDDLGTSIKKKSRDVLKKGGRFVQIHYSLLEKSSYEKIFGNIDVSFEARNIPPAFVMVCEKK